MGTNESNRAFPIGQHPPLPPPPAERGIVKWFRERLFNSWYNTLGTAVMLDRALGRVRGIIGSGVGGLTTAYELLSRNSAVHVTVLEARERVGGQWRASAIHAPLRSPLGAAS